MHRDVVVLGTLKGLQIFQTDVDRFFLFLVLREATACDTFIGVFSWFFFAATIVAIPGQIIIGWFLDSSEDDAAEREQQQLHQRETSSTRIQFVAALVQMCSFLFITALGWGGAATSTATTVFGIFSRQDLVLFALIMAHLVRQIAIMIVSAVSWKTVKFYLQRLQQQKHLLNSSEDEIEYFVNSVGNFGDTFCNVMGLLVLGGAALLIGSYGPSSQATGTVRETNDSWSFSAALQNWLNIRTDTDIFNSVYWLVIGSVAVSNVAIVGFAFYLHHCSSHGQSNTETASIRFEDRENGATTCATILPPLAEPDGGVTRHQVNGAQPHMTVLAHLYVRIRYLFRTHLLLHLLSHYFALFLFVDIVAYPLTISSSTSSDQDSLDPTDASPFCGRVLSNLIVQGAYLYLVYLVASLAYGAFLVRINPAQYFGHVYPLVSLCLLVVLSCMIFVDPSVQTQSNGGLLHEVLMHVLLSVTQVVPYYLSMFDYYVLVSFTNKYYGFVNSICGLGTQALYFAPAVLLLLPLSRTVLVVLCGSLLGLSVVQAYSCLSNPKLFRISQTSSGDPSAAKQQ